MGLWALSLVACIAVGLLLLQLYQQSTEAQLGRAEAVVARACDLIRDRYGFYAAGWTGPQAGQFDDRLRADLGSAVGVALAHLDGVEGGIWQLEVRSLAYAFPTYEGTGPKTDLPTAERDQIQAVNQQAARDEQSTDQHVTSGSQTLLLHACPLPGPIGGLTAWTMTRVRTVQGFRPLKLGLGVLLALMLLVSAWLRSDFDPAAHVRVGELIAPLRDEGVVIIGSGFSFHNTRAMLNGTGAKSSAAFDRWLDDTLVGASPQERLERVIHWDKAPAARAAHPREDHLLPLMVAVGAAGGDAGTRVYHQPDFMGAITASSYRFGAAVVPTL